MVDIPVECAPLEAVPPCHVVGFAAFAAGYGTVGGIARCGTLSADCGVSVSGDADACAAQAVGLAFYPLKCTVTIRPASVLAGGGTCWVA